jgi:3-oxoacyl-[acyl-carrier protein] reductase
MDLGLRGKVAMVGGGSKGLGYAVARALAGEGARVAIASRGADGVAQAADRIRRETASEVVGVAADLATVSGIERWHAETTKQFGGVDLLFANTGGPPAGTALSFDDDAWQSAFELLLMSAVRTVRLVIPSMRARGGGAILIGTSSTVKEPTQLLALSNVMRAGVTALAKTLSVELAPDRIRVNTLVPGRIATDRLSYLDSISAQKAGVPVEEQKKRSEAAIPLGHYGEPDQFGHVGAFLLSAAASYMTGSAVYVDGGLLRTI